MPLKAVATISLCLAALCADEPQLKPREPLPQNGVTEYRVEQGKRIPCKLLNTISILNFREAGLVYLQTVFPVVVSNHTVIPAGTYVDARVTEVRHARAKGQAELFILLGRLTLPNGTQRRLEVCSGRFTAAISTRGSGVVIVPGTTADVVLQDPIVFPVEDAHDR